jgi:SulP family sulfate permease
MGMFVLNWPNPGISGRFWAPDCHIMSRNLAWAGVGEERWHHSLDIRGSIMRVLDLKRENLLADVTAGLTTALVTVPDGMASAILAGVSPIHGLYALMFGTPVAALTTSAQFMYVANTGALAVAVGSALAGISEAQLVESLIVLTVLVGLFQLLLGLLKLGTLLRFVSNAVLTGFMTGIAVLIILGQLGHLAGYESEVSNKVLQGIDLVLHPGRVHWQSLGTGLAAMAMILLVQRTRLAKFSMVLSMVGAALLVYLLGWTSVDLVADIASIPRGLPAPTLPDPGLVPGLLFPAMAVGIIGLVQGAGVSKTVPNPGGAYSDVSRDFAGKGVANLASGFFRGMPIGGTMSETAVNVSAGARSRWANIFSGLFIIAIVLLLGSLVGRFPLPAIAALLIVAGYEAIDREEVLDVWDIGRGPRLIMAATFLATLALPVQWAVLVGVVLSVLHHVYSASLDVQLVEMTLLEDGSFEERPAPAQLDGDRVTIVRAYGTSFFASMDTMERMLPSAEGAARAVVILNLRGRQSIGSSFVRVAERYAARLRTQGGKLMLSGVNEQVMRQLERTETTEDIPAEDIFMATSKVGASTRAAAAAAREWLLGEERPEATGTDAE